MPVPAVRPATSRIPGTGGVDDVVALTQVRMVKRIVLGALHHWRRFDRGQRSPVQLHRDRVERNIVLAGYLCSGRVCSQPLFEIVPQIIQLGAIRFHDVAVEIDFFAVWWLGRRIGTYWIAFELDNRTRIVDCRALAKESAFAFGRVEPRTPNAITVKPIEQNISSVTRIFFIVC